MSVIALKRRLKKDSKRLGYEPLFLFKTSSIVSLSISDTYRNMFFKAVQTMPSLKDVSWGYIFITNEFVKLYLALNSRKHASLNINVGYVYQSYFRDRSKTKLIVHGYILGLLASRVDRKFTCFTGSVTHDIFIKNFYTSADKGSRRQIKKNEIPKISVGAFLRESSPKFGSGLNLLSEYVQLYKRQP